MRRVLVGVGLGASWLILAAGPAGAHPGIENPYVPAHVVTTVALGVPSEEPSPLVEVDVTLPPDFALQRVDSVPGWQEESAPGRVRFFNGNVAQGGFAQFTLSGTFADKRIVDLPVTTRAADGTTVTWDEPQGSAHPAAQAFPGYPIGSAPGGAGTGRGGAVPLIGVGLVVVLAGGLALAAAATRRRRSLTVVPE